MQVADFYNGFYTIIQNYVYGGNLVDGSYEQMCTALLATICAMGLIILPFVALYCGVRALTRLWRF